VDAWAWPFRKRWKGRLGISLRGYSFIKVLRMDYFTDWIALLCIFNIFFANLFIGAYRYSIVRCGSEGRK
jgi:hypothetical protein